MEGAAKMNKIRMIIVPALVLATCGCAGMSNSEKGFVGGGLFGAGIGALAGAALHNPAAGAAIGGVAGAGIGGLAGAVKDNREEKAREAHDLAMVKAAQAQANAKRITVTDVIGMAQNHISDQIIINEIRSTNSNFDLRPEDITLLKANGVSDAVVLEMQTRHYQPIYTTPNPVIVPAPVYRETIIYEEPRPVMGVGFGYYGGCRRW
jgi:hypothetical protein